MKILLLILASLIAIIGAAAGIMFFLMTIPIFFGGAEYFVLLFALPFACFSAIGLLIGFRYMRRRDAETAEGIAAITGVSIWLFANTQMMDLDIRPDDGPLFLANFLGPILCGLVTYKVFLWGIRRSFAKTDADDMSPDNSGTGE